MSVETQRRRYSVPRAELVFIEATDRLVLPGLLYEPDARTKTAVVWLHGNGDASVFYAPRTNILARAFTRAGIAFLPFNNRGAHLIRKLARATGGRRRSVTRGTAYERIRESIRDIEGAIAFLRSRGYTRVILAGHSSGANKICVYNYYRRSNPAAAFILLGAGDDVGLYFSDWGPSRFRRMLRVSRERIAADRGGELVPGGVTPFPLSFASLHDTINPDGDYNIFPFLDRMRGLGLSKKRLFREYRAIRKPTLVIFGDRDEFCFGEPARCLQILEEEAAGREDFDFLLLRDADHGFHGAEARLGRALAAWVTALPDGSASTKGGRSGRRASPRPR